MRHHGTMTISVVPRKARRAAREPRAALRPRLEPDKVILAHGQDWTSYLVIDKFLEGSGARVSYCDGIIQFMSTSRDHERIKQNISHMIARYCQDEDIEYASEGHATRRLEGRRATEPDDSFYFSAERQQQGSVPDLVIEVALSSGGLDKLSMYEPLGVPELWIWENGRMAVHRFEGGKYRPSRRSGFLPGLDPQLVAKLATGQPTSAVIREFVRRKK
jgi:Uma2 family endonuclease